MSRKRHYLPQWQKTHWAGGRAVGYLKDGVFLKFLPSKAALVRKWQPRFFLSHNAEHYDDVVRKLNFFQVELKDTGERWQSDIRDWELHKFGPFNLGTDKHYGLEFPTYWQQIKVGVEQQTMFEKERAR